LLKSSAFGVRPLDDATETPLHEIRSVRDLIVQAVRRTRTMRVAPAMRTSLLANLGRIDAELLDLYRSERNGVCKADYDRVVARETNDSEPPDS